MHRKKRIRDHGIQIGRLQPGERNAITDVEGVTVGQVTLSDGDMQTGVTAVLPYQGNLFKYKLIAASHVFNGFGKSIGLVQINELGTLETPIILTNTFSVGTCAEALIDYMLHWNPEIGRSTGTVNPVVCECNDMVLNDIRTRFVRRDHVFSAINRADKTFEEGGAGAGTGMVCYGLKGGIGTASRVLHYPHGTYTIGVLVLANFGRRDDLMVNGHMLGAMMGRRNDKEPEKGSVIIIIATDLPVSSRQLNRIIKRSAVGLSRTGSFIGNGSGDIAIGFSTAGHIPHDHHSDLLALNVIHENDIDQAFHAVAEATEESVLNALVTADPVTGRNGQQAESLCNYMDLL
ncbi:D-aminopeptidase [Scopulibacillus darangshiensis]|uniref:D-aminopeptidase n=1 Tax=Scopulibacillus darangshiensis TaxID=442528 RepID=A0A4R2P989_9BACL|nr:P1 family peptidase [Scopulibacillus darangshiensis]TCP30631.1 D-aminopeptidase [Scopulibacillus darangshiensis]